MTKTKPAFPIEAFQKWFYRNGERLALPTPQECGIWAWNLAHESQAIEVDESLPECFSRSQDDVRDMLRQHANLDYIEKLAANKSIEVTMPKLKESGTQLKESSASPCPGNVSQKVENGDTKTAESVEAAIEESAKSRCMDDDVSKNAESVEHASEHVSDMLTSKTAESVEAEIKEKEKTK